MTAHQNKNSASKTILNHDVIHKGQLILKCPFGVFKSPKKPTKLFPGGQIKKKSGHFIPLIGGFYFNSLTLLF